VSVKLKANASPYGDSLRAHHQAVEAFLLMGRAGAVSTLIVDPPRTGLSAVRWPESFS
jgi:hypothetical protein